MAKDLGSSIAGKRKVVIIERTSKQEVNNGNNFNT